MSEESKNASNSSSIKAAEIARIDYFSLSPETFTEDFVKEHAATLAAILDMPPKMVVEATPVMEYLIKAKRDAALEKRKREELVLEERRQRQAAEEELTKIKKQLVAVHETMNHIQVRLLLADAVTASLTDANNSELPNSNFVDYTFTQVSAEYLRSLYQEWLRKRVKLPSVGEGEKPAYHRHMSKLLQFLLAKMKNNTKWRMVWEKRVFLCAGKLRKEPDWMLLPYYERYAAASSLCCMGEVKARKRKNASKEDLMKEAVTDSFHYSLVSLRQRVDMEPLPLELGNLCAIAIATNVESIQLMRTELIKGTNYAVQIRRRHSPWLSLTEAPVPALQPTPGFIALVRLLLTPPETLYGAQTLAQSVPFGDGSVKLLDRLGRGASADVYTAAWPYMTAEGDTDTGAAIEAVTGAPSATYVNSVRECAVKRLRHVDNTKISEFEHEASVLRDLRGVPGVPSLIYAHIPNKANVVNAPYIVIEPVGVPLSHFLYDVLGHNDDDCDDIGDEEGDKNSGTDIGSDRALITQEEALAGTHQLAPEELVRRANIVFSTLSETLDHIAAKGWAQIDLRPANIVWANDRAYLVDWGSAARIGYLTTLHGAPQFLGECCNKAESIYDAIEAGFGEKRVKAKIDREALVYTYSAMLHGGRALGAPWALMPINPDIAAMRRDWYRVHAIKAPSCPCLEHYRALEFI